MSGNRNRNQQQGWRQSSGSNNGQRNQRSFGSAGRGQDYQQRNKRSSEHFDQSASNYGRAKHTRFDSPAQQNNYQQGSRGSGHFNSPASNYNPRNQGRFDSPAQSFGQPSPYDRSPYDQHQQRAPPFPSPVAMSSPMMNPNMQSPMVNLMDIPSLLPPPPAPPHFGTGNRSFIDYSYSSSSQTDLLNTSWRTASTLVPDKPTDDTFVDEMTSKGDGEYIVISDEDHSEEGEPEDEKHVDLQAKLNQLMNLDKNQVPEYILRMRDLGPQGYPPALIDEHVRVCNTLPLFSDSVDNILPKRKIDTSKLPAFRGYTHLKGTKVSEEFAELMRKVAELDYDQSREEALERSGLDTTKSAESDSSNGSPAKKPKMTGTIHFEIPKYEVAESDEYQFGIETKKMKHSLERFADGIQPFQNSHVNKPTHFMSKLKNILSKGANNNSSSSQPKEEGEIPDSPTDK